MKHDQCKAKADKAWQSAYDLLSQELNSWEKLADVNSEMIWDIDNRIIGYPYTTSEDWETLFTNLKHTLSLLANQYTWFEDLVKHERTQREARQQKESN